MEVAPGEVAMIPRGVRFSVHLLTQQPAGTAAAASSASAAASSSSSAHGSGAGDAPAGSAAAQCIGARGYVLEVFQGMFALPDLGPIGEQA